MSRYKVRLKIERLSGGSITAFDVRKDMETIEQALEATKEELDKVPDLNEASVFIKREGV